MAEIQFKSEIDVELVQKMGGDEMVVAAAKVSTTGMDALAFASAEHVESNAGLINYLMKHRHGTPFEHASMTFFVHAPICVWREWHRHRIGFCVSGDTDVTLETIAPRSGRTIRKRPIVDLWDRWHNGVKDRAHVRKAGASGNIAVAVEERVRHLPKCRDFTCRVLNEETQFFELGKPVDIIQSGVKEMLLVESGNRKLKCSADHRIYTDDGWVRAGDLRKGDRIAVAGKRSKFAERQIPPSLRSGIGVWTTMQRNRLIGDSGRCYVCGDRYVKPMLVLDHVVPVAADLTRALDITNLKPICESCHKVKTAGEQKLARRANVAGSKFVKLDSTPSPVSEEMSYDMSMGGQHHNFVANGIVVHNSFNEESGRYKKLEPIFYLPKRNRPMMKVDGWKPGRPKFLECTDPAVFNRLTSNLAQSYVLAYEMYEANLALGVDPGLARDCLPVGIYSGCWVTCNPRSLMAFLSLRTHEPDARFVSYPLHEIEEGARACEKMFAEGWPITYKAFCDNGRVAP